MESVTEEWLKGLWGSSATDIYTVGENGTILRYNGSHWSKMKSWTMEHLYAVWGSSGTDIYAVGAAGTILHYDGVIWSSMESGTKESLRGIWGSSMDTIFAVGDNSTILYYDGSRWSSMNSGTTAWLLGVWGSSRTDIFAVGGYYDGISGWWDRESWDGGVILHYDGDTWYEMENEIPEHLYGVWGSVGTDIYTVGAYGTILHYDGGTGDQDDCVIESLYRGNSEKVELVRYFRDSVLNKTPEGRDLITLYYQWSPVIVKAMEENEEFREEVREMVDGVLLVIRRDVE